MMDPMVPMVPPPLSTPSLPSRMSPGAPVGIPTDPRTSSEELSIETLEPVHRARPPSCACESFVSDSAPLSLLPASAPPCSVSPR